MLRWRDCPRCHGATTREGLCGICHAVVFGLSDEEFEAVALAFDEATGHGHLKARRAREAAERRTYKKAKRGTGTV